MGRPPHGIGKDALKGVIVYLPIRILTWVDRIGPNRSAVVRKALEALKSELEKAKKSKG